MLPGRKVTGLLQEANQLTAIFYNAISTTRSRPAKLPKS